MTKYRFGDDSPIEDPVMGALKDRPAQRKVATPTGMPQTWVGQQTAKHNEGLQQRIERLEAERKSGQVVLMLDPKKVRATTFKNRLDESLASTDEQLIELRDDIRANGMLEPIRVRPVANSDEYEIIVGHRRHAAALLLDAETEGGFRVSALLDARAADTRQLVLQMHAENEVRKDLSAYEKGLQYRQWLNAGVFAEQGDIADAVRKSKQTISRYLQVADLPVEVLAAFPRPTDVRIFWMQELLEALKASEASVLAAAKRIAAMPARPSAEDVFKALVAAAAKKAGGAKKNRTTREEPVKIKGRVAFRSKRSPGRIAFDLKLPLSAVEQNELAEKLIATATAFCEEKFEAKGREP